MFDPRSILRRLRPDSWSLRARSGALILACAAIPALLLGAALATADYLSARASLDARLASAVNVGARNVDLYIDEYLHALTMLARDWSGHQRDDEAWRLGRLDDLLKVYPDFITVLATDDAGALTASAPRTSSDGRFDFWRGLRVEDRAYFSRPRDDGRPFVSNLIKGRGYGSDFIFAVTAPILRQGRFEGVIEGSLPSARFARHCAATSESPGLELLVTDADGKIAYASAGLGLKVGDSAADWPEFHDDVTAGTRYMGAQRITAHGWRVTSLASRGLLTESAYTAVALALALVALALIAALAILPMATRAFSEHITRVADRMRAFSLADGELSASVLDVPRELEPVHEAFSTLGRKLRHTFAQLHAALDNERALRAELEGSRVEIEASERRLRLVLESVPEGVVVISAQGEVVLWNRAADPLLGLGPATDGGPPRLLFPDGAPHPPPAQMLLRTFVEGSFDSVALLMRCPRVGDMHFLASARVLRDAQGAVRGAVGVFRDVTRERAAQEQLMISDRMASIGMLAAGVGHEINNPLAALMADIDAALGELGAADAPGARARASLVDARQACAHIRDIVRDLKYFARHDSETVGQCDLNRMLESSARMAASQIKPRARLVVDLRAPLSVRGSESRLGQVFLNLLVNAAQAIDEGRAEANSITLRSQVGDDDRVIVEVIDTGKGMSPEVQRRLFTPFFTTKPQGIGTGLGLTICQKIVTEAGGVIEVDSDLGRGTTFRVRLIKSEVPAATAVPVVPAQPVALAEPATSARRRGRVLVVDDERLIASAIRRVLGREHEVLDCTRAEDALRLIESDEPLDVILCDLMMPGMSGMDLHERLLRDHPRAAGRMIFLTGGAFTAQAKRFLAEVPCPCVEKPFDADVLRGLVNQRVV